MREISTLANDVTAENANLRRHIRLLEAAQHLSGELIRMLCTTSTAASEAAYKRGYARGRADALAGKKD